MQYWQLLLLVCSAGYYNWAAEMIPVCFKRNVYVAHRPDEFQSSHCKDGTVKIRDE